MSHTPAPWRVSKDHPGNLLAGDSLLAIFYCPSRARVMPTDAEREEAKANARLAAAAPDLLSAARIALGKIRDGDVVAARSVLSFVITKATGAES